MKAPWMDSGLRDLVVLALLSAFGCGLAMAHDDLFSSLFLSAPAQ
jgi:hypothetical protein